MQYANLWHTLRQVLDIADRNGAGWCQLWTSTAENVLSPILPILAEVSPISGGVHHYIRTRVPIGNKIELECMHVEHLLRQNARALELRHINIPRLSGAKLIGEIGGRPMEPAILDGTSDQFLGHGLGTYGGFSVIPTSLRKIYSREQ